MPLDVRLVIEKIKGERDLTPSRLQQVQLRAMQQSVMIVLRRAKLNLTGRFLKVQTGRLRSSLTGFIGLKSGEVVGMVGTNVWYGKLHEFGGTFSVTRRHQARFRRTLGGGLAFAKKRSRVVYESLPVQRTYSVTYPSRPWLRTALAESKADILRTFGRAIAAAKVNIGGGTSA